MKSSHISYTQDPGIPALGHSGDWRPGIKQGEIMGLFNFGAFCLGWRGTLS